MLGNIGTGISAAGGAVAAATGSTALGAAVATVGAHVAGAIMGGMQQGRRDPDVQFAYAVEIDGLTSGYFTEVSGIKYEMESDPVREGGFNNHEQHLLGRAKFGPLTLKRGFIGADNALYKMMADTLNPWLPIFRKTVHVIVLARNVSGSTGGGPEELGRISFFKAFVSEWSGPQMATKTSDFAVESVTFKYDWLEFQPGNTTSQLISNLLGAAVTGGMMAAFG